MCALPSLNAESGTGGRRPRRRGLQERCMTTKNYYSLYYRNIAISIEELLKQSRIPDYLPVQATNT
jgi:hypothetical protein